MKKVGIIALMFFVGFTFNAQQQNEVDSYKVAFYSKDATGVFKEMSGTVESNKSDITLDVQASDQEATDLDLSFHLKIKVGSINTGNGVQNKHAKSSEWFHAEKYPTIDFVSSRVYKTEKGIFADGSLTLHGVTKKVSIPISIKDSDEKTIYKAEFSVNRMDYKLGPDSKVSRNIKIIAGIAVKK
jgi:polyisoprenoid-binding protein YceI